jgi:hypothetical protein
MPLNKYGLTQFSWLTIAPALFDNLGTFDVVEYRMVDRNTDDVTRVARGLTREAAEQYVAAHS